MYVHPVGYFYYVTWLVTCFYHVTGLFHVCCKVCSWDCVTWLVMWRIPHHFLRNVTYVTWLCDVTYHVTGLIPCLLQREFVIPRLKLDAKQIKHTLTHTHTLSLSLSHTHTHSLSLTHTHTHTRTHTLIYTHTRTHTHTPHTRTHTHTHTHTNKHTGIALASRMNVICDTKQS